MTDADVERYEARLRERLAELDELSTMSAESRARVVLDQQSVGRLSRMDAMQGQAMALATEQRRAQERSRIQVALRRIDSGDFGLCMQCEEDIDPRRLELDPSAPLCLRCAESRG